MAYFLISNLLPIKTHTRSYAHKQAPTNQTVLDVEIIPNKLILNCYGSTSAADAAAVSLLSELMALWPISLS